MDSSYAFCFAKLPRHCTSFKALCQKPDVIPDTIATTAIAAKVSCVIPDFYIGLEDPCEYIGKITDFATRDEIVARKLQVMAGM
jgi:hypothetical protein